MMIGNKPKEAQIPVEGKRYWWIAIGRNVCPHRYLSEGWRGFELVIFAPYKKRETGEAMPYKFRFAFAFWLPFYAI